MALRRNNDRPEMNLRVLIPALLIAAPALAGEVTVTDVQATETAPGIYRFDVTLLHEDEGWDHYADAWEVLDPDGNLLATRVLAHPHVNEQPFTRSLTGVEIPDGLTTVLIRGRDNVHGVGEGIVFVFE